MSTPTLIEEAEKALEALERVTHSETFYLGPVIASLSAAIERERAAPARDFYFSGPYTDGTYSICESGTGRVRWVFNPATDDHHVEADAMFRITKGINTRAAPAGGEVDEWKSIEQFDFAKDANCRMTWILAEVRAGFDDYLIGECYFGRGPVGHPLLCPEPERQAWRYLHSNKPLSDHITPTHFRRPYRTPSALRRAAAPMVPRQPMTQEQADELWLTRDCIGAINNGDMMAQVRWLVRAVEAAHGIGAASAN